ncbi:MAG TPA: LuxR C-terminal-related transcriptional regulator [Solirubrobacteraceae bacterium]|nr:LuxR C-terminal-related transcriptional regulator [Solirubrobacteraceae bacterium]
MGELGRGREAHAGERWAEGYDSLVAADRSDGLGAADLELLATCAYMLGRVEDYFRCLERAYQAYLREGSALAAVRCAFWIGVHLAQRGEMGGAGGWLGRAQGLLDREEADRVEAGYLLLPRVFEQEGSGDLEAASVTATEAAAIGERFGDSDLFALAAHEHGHILIRLGRPAEGLVLLDAAMVLVTAGELSPVVSGIVYCGVILACRDAHELGRAREWTAALSAWCERQPDLVAFTGRCLVHRAEIMQLGGDWPAALEEARRAKERCLRGENPKAAGDACYQRGEVHRLRGEFTAAEEAYREASAHGREPQPGLALLRLAEGNVEAAAASIRRVLVEADEPGKRAAVLPGYIEIMLAVDELEAALDACRELSALAAAYERSALGATALRARGALELARGDPRAALAALRRAAAAWQQLEAPYEAARVRELLGLACRELGDEDAVTLELGAARDAFERLGAAPDLARLSTLLDIVGASDSHGLTERELEVLRLVAAGKSNREIAGELVISEHTVARHLQNIFAKLGLSSRTAASAFAFEHHLV